MPRHHWIIKKLRNHTDSSNRRYFGFGLKRGFNKGYDRLLADPTFPDGWELGRIQDALSEIAFERGQEWFKKRGYTEKAVLGCRWLGISAPALLGDWREGQTREGAVLTMEESFRILIADVYPDGTLDIDIVLPAVDDKPLGWEIPTDLRPGFVVAFQGVLKMLSEPKMHTQLYFAADLSHVLLSLPQPPPASLWYTPAVASGAATPSSSVAVWLLTPATLARILYQIAKLERRHASGDYPLDRIAETRSRVEPLVVFAADAFGRDACEAAIAALAAAGGPKRPLPQPEPMPANPFDLTPLTTPTRRWNGVKMRWDVIPTIDTAP